MDALFSHDQQQRPWRNQELHQQLLHMLNPPTSTSTSLHSSSSSSVPSLTSSDGSIPPDVQQSEGEAFHDPTLQYINMLLMEEDMEDAQCTFHESIAYQATVKSFYDILNDNNEHLSFSTFTDGEDFRVTEQDLYHLNTAEEHHRQETEGRYLDRVQWSKCLLKPVSETSSVRSSETEFRLQQEPEPCVPRNANGNSNDSSGSFKQQYSNESLKQKILNGSLGSQVSNESWKQRMLNGSLRPPALSGLKQHASNSQPDGFISIPRPLTSLANHGMTFNNLSVSTDSSGLKRSTPEKNNSNDDDADNGEEDSVSFVKNKELQAENFAKALNEGVTEFIEKLKKIGPKPLVAPPKSHKSNALKLETTADLKNMLLSCAQAVGDGNTRRANEILKEIRQEATPYGNDLQRLAHYFAEGLVARITGTGAVVYTTLSNNMPSATKMLKTHQMFVEVSPFHKISNFFANRAIVEAAKDAYRLHIIDYGIFYGLQWPYLISALAERKGGPPFLRMTIVEFPAPGNNPSGRVERIGQKLSEYARAYGVPFEYQAIADKWENVTASSVGLRDGEILVVNSRFRLHQVPDESVRLHDPRTMILKNILEMNPKLFVHGVVNGSYTSPFFLPRFREALSSYYSMFDMMEAILPRDSQERLMFERESLGRQIMNVVACEGQERVQRPATYKQWQSRMESVGFKQMVLDEKMVNDVQDIVRQYYNKNFNIDTDGNWMLIGWKGKINKAMTLWRPG